LFPVFRGVMDNHFLRHRLEYATALFGIVLGCSSALWSQQSQQHLSYTPSSLIDPSNSRAEKEAEQTVSLSPDKIIFILRDETGLMLQVKKALVRTAFEQGRVLDPDELTDDAVFRLIREDDKVRIIVTREIEDRQYVRAKPTREELARNLPCRQPMQSMQSMQSLPTVSESLSKSQDSTSSADTKASQTQEEAYWAKHESDLDCYLTQYLPYGTTQAYGQPLNAQSPFQQQQNPFNQYPQQQYPQQQYPQQQFPQQQYPQQQYPQSQPGLQSPYTDYRRQLQLTQMQPSQGYFGMDNDESQMAGIQADELSSLLSASQTGSAPSMGRQGLGATGGSGSGLSGLSLPSSMGSSLGSSMSSIGSLGSLGSLLHGQDTSSGFPEEASLQQQMAPQLPPYFPSLPQRPRLSHPPNPYADVPSLYDLYAQYPRHLPTLERFGQDIFRNGTGNLEDLPMDVPAGPDYVVGPGDGLTINLTGGVSERLQRVVDREGRVVLPEVGAVEVSGRNLGDVQHMVQTVLRGQFRDVSADVSLSRIRTVRIYVVGDVERPGPYDVSSLSTPLNAVFMAGGPTSAGSLRVVQHYRGKQLVQEVDVYDLLLHGVRADLKGLQPGDTIRVPPLRAGVTIAGMVRRPAIYELNGETNLAQVLELAGGVLPTGTLRHVDVERVEDHVSRTMLRLDIPETNNQAQVTQALDDFKIQDGDKIRITPILPYADKTVYLDGYVSRPGKFAYRDGMKVTDLIGSYKDLLPEPSTTHAEIIRLSQPDFTPTVLAFNLGDALAGKDPDLVLKPFDTVRIFSKYDFEDLPVITVTGEVRDPGDHLTNGSPHLRDAVYLAGGPTSDALLDDAQVFRKTRDGKITVISVNLAKALQGDEKDNLLLEGKDRVFIHRDLNKMDPPTVAIEGEVGRPGKYPLGEDMSASDLVRVAGGFKRGAFTQEADLTRYEVAQGTKVVSDHVEVPIAQAMTGEADADVRLRDGDVLTIRQITGWKDVGATIKVTGEVLHPGTYGIQEGERLSSVIQRAGGFRDDAYPYGSVLERVQVRELQEKDRFDLIERIKSEQSDVKLLPGMDTDELMTARAAVLQYKTTITNLENTPPTGRLVIHISSDMKHWEDTPADLYVRAGDDIYIPKKPNIVIVNGSVYNPTAITYKPGKNAGWYLRQAGGPTDMANKKAVFVVRADGSVVGGPGGLFSGGAEQAELRPGDMVVVPEKAYSINTKWKTTLEAAQLVSALGVATFYATRF
jgi:protein involved in polysaccharide export with SLBB domain